MDDAKEYTEMVLNDISKNYDIDEDELAEKYMYDEENKDIKQELPEISFTKKIIDDVIFFRDDYGNIYNEKFEYIEKEELNRKRKKKSKKRRK